MRRFNVRCHDSSSAFTLRKAHFSSVATDRPSAAACVSMTIGWTRFPGASTPILTLRRVESAAKWQTWPVVDYRHGHPPLPPQTDGALNLAPHRDQLFPPGLALDVRGLLGLGEGKRACQAWSAVLALAHERACEAELAANPASASSYDAGRPS